MHALGAEEVERIEVGCGHMTFVHTAWPYRPAGVAAAQMNMFYGLSVVALGGDASAADYREERLADPAILGVIPCIAVREDPLIEALGPAFRHACRLTVRTKDGRTLRHEVLHRRASPENPVTPAEVEAKFRSVTRGILGEAEAERIVDVVCRFEALEDLSPLTAILGAER